MKGLFSPDVFSNPKPLWKAIEGPLSEVLQNILPFIETGEDWTEVKVDYSGAFEINSSNIRVTFPNGDRFLLKRWPAKALVKDINAVLEIMSWLAGRSLPVPDPKKFTNGSNIIQYQEHYWNYFDFIEGDYFSAIGEEFDNVAVATGDLALALSEMPLNLYPTQGFMHLTDEDDAAFNDMYVQKNDWDEIFGADHAQMLRDAWPSLIENWRNMRSNIPDAGPLMPMHVDMHPHNLLVNNGQVTAILDFEACRMIRVGCALAFNALKQCRQAMVVNPEANPGDTGKKYIETIVRKFPVIEPYKNNFCQLASMEVIRRICVIFRVSGQKTWNHVLPIQLRHLEEARLLFA
jgi:hypothetical protein